MILPKIIAVVGPTASGKTDRGIFLAKKFNGEVVSFDSRQIYQYMNIGTAKPEGQWMLAGERKFYMVDDVPHHLVDFVDPSRIYSLADFQLDAYRVIDDILARGKLPILVGGTGLYLRGVIDNLDLAAAPPNMEIRKKLAQKSATELAHMLQIVDPQSAALVDLHNPRRVTRALEVFLSTGESMTIRHRQVKSLYEVMQVGLLWSRTELNMRINQRVDQQIKAGLVEETQKLCKSYAWNLPSMSSIGYRQIGGYVRGEMNLSEAIDQLKRDTRRYAKRQLTWFRSDSRIKWLNGAEPNAVTDLVQVFLN